MSDDDYKKESRNHRNRDDGSRNRSIDRDEYRKRSSRGRSYERKPSKERKRQSSSDRSIDRREHGRSRGLVLTDSTRFEIDQNQVGAIIGRGGSNIRDIQHQFSVVINVDKNSNYRGKTGVKVSGDSLANIEDAIHHIKMQIKDNNRRYGRDVGKFRDFDRDFDKRRYKSPEKQRRSRERNNRRERSVSPIRDRSPIRRRRSYSSQID